MEELLDLHEALLQHRYKDALEIVDEMTAMAKKDILDKISSYIRVLLIYLIKSHAEQKMTRSWQNSIYYALDEIRERNTREKSAGTYMHAEDFRIAIDKRFASALRAASLEAFEGKYELREFVKFIDADAVKTQALEYILNGYSESED